MSKKTSKTKDLNEKKKQLTFLQNFKKIKWAKLFGKDATLFPLYLKVLFFTVLLTGVLFGLDYLINYIWSVVAWF